MLYDTHYRHNDALSPEALGTLRAALHALNAGVDDCRRAGKPTPKPGQTIIFDEPMRFSDGSDRSRFEVVANPKGKTPLFRDPESRAICRIPAFRKRAYRIVHAAIFVRDAASG